jgi:periplasmic protein TonB
MIFRNTVIVAFCLFKMVAFSQVDSPLLPIHDDRPIVKFTQNNDTIFYIYDTQPEFAGGIRALYDFIKENLRFPNPNLYCDYTGTVYIGFVVNIEGRIEEINIKKGLGVAFNEEAIRVLKLTSGKWKAGKLNGRAVNVAYTMPIKFKLE